MEHCIPSIWKKGLCKKWFRLKVRTKHGWVYLSEEQLTLYDLFYLTLKQKYEFIKVNFSWLGCILFCTTVDGYENLIFLKENGPCPNMFYLYKRRFYSDNWNSQFCIWYWNTLSVSLDQQVSLALSVLIS